MENSIAGGLYGGISIADRGERARGSRVRRHVRGVARLPDDRRPRVRRQHARFRSRVGETVQWDVMAMGDEFHTFHVHGHRWRTDGGTPEDTRGLGPAESFRVRWRETRRDLAVPLPRRVAHDAGDDRDLQGDALMRRPRARRRGSLAAAGVPAAASAETATIRMPGKFFDPSRSTVVAGDLVVFRNNDLVSHDVRIAGGMFDSGLIVHFSCGRSRSTCPAATRSSARCTRSWPATSTRSRPRSPPPRTGARGRAAGASAERRRHRPGRGRAVRRGRRVDRDRNRGRPSRTAPSRRPSRRSRRRATASRRRPGRARRSLRACRRASPSTSRSGTRQAHLGAGSHDAGDDGLHGHAGALLALALPLAPAAARQARRPRPRDVRVPASRRTFARVALSRGRRAPALVRSGVVALRTGRSARDPDTIVPPGGGHHGAQGDEGHEHSG